MGAPLGQAPRAVTRVQVPAWLLQLWAWVGEGSRVRLKRETAEKISVKRRSFFIKSSLA